MMPRVMMRRVAAHMTIVSHRQFPVRCNICLVRFGRTYDGQFWDAAKQQIFLLLALGLD
jgi:hypothetical protein